MAKSKEGREDEFYKGQIRALKSENRNLKKRIRRLEKDLLYDFPRDDIEVEEVDAALDCPECGKSTLTELILLQRSFMKCDLCGYRSKATKL